MSDEKPVDDGGPAHPLPIVLDGRQMLYSEVHGMSLRDYFAGQALAGWCANSGAETDFEYVAHGCYKQADAMLVAREKP